MVASKQELYTRYSEYLFSVDTPMASIGRELKNVSVFLNTDCEVSKQGYREFLRSPEFAAMDKFDETKTDILKFLQFNRVGAKSKSKKEYKVTPLSKLADVSERNKEVIAGFANWLTESFDLSPHTVSNYVFTAKSFYSYATVFNQDNAKRYVAALEQEGKQPKTIRLRITALEKMSEYLRKPIKLKKPKVAVKMSTENIPTEREYNKMLDYLREHNYRYYLMLRVLATTGARISEFLQFTFESIAEGSVVLRGKGNKYRRFFFQKEVVREVSEYAAEHHLSGPFATNRSGGALSSRGFTEMLHTVADKVGVDRSKAHAHAFRHFFAKMYLKKNQNIVALAELMGHGSIETTRVYLQRSEAEQRRDFNRNVNW